MSDIATKLAYLNTTKGKIKDTINYTGAGITESDTFRSYARTLKDSFVDIINDGTGTLYDNFPKATDEGSETTLNNVYEAPMGLEVEGKIDQNNYSGKNLYGGFTYSRDHNGISFQYNQDGTISATGTATGTAISMLSSGATPYLKTLSAGTYTISGSSNDAKIQIIKSDGTLVLQTTDFDTFTLSEETQIFVRLSVSSGTQLNNIKIYQMLEKSSTATDYEPYVGGISSPNPDYPQEIKTVSGIENLFDKDNVTNGYRLTQDGQGVVDANYYVSPWIKIEPNTIYTKNSPTADAYHRFCFYTSNNTETFLSRSENNTATSPSNAQYMRICGLLTELDTTQIEKGTTAHTPVPYGHWLPVKVSNKNLFDSEYYYNYTINTSNHIVFPQANRYGFLVKVKPNTTYTFSRSDVGTASLSFIALLNDFVYGVDNPYIDAVNIGSALTYTITTTNDTNYIMILTGAGYSSDVQLEESPITTDYIQHEEQTTLIDLNKYDENNNIVDNYELCSIGDTKDLLTIKDGKAILNKNISNIVLDGSENWAKSTSSSTSNYLVCYYNSNNATGVDYSNAKSDYFVYGTVGSSSTENCFQLYTTDNNLGINIKIDINKASTVADFKNWLSTHNTELYYTLETPETITLKGTYNLKTYEEVTHIEIDDDLEPNMIASGLTWE